MSAMKMLCSSLTEAAEQYRNGLITDAEYIILLGEVRLTAIDELREELKAKRDEATNQLALLA